MMMPNLNELLSLRDVVSPDAPTALYCRLSVDDANEGDSNSIAHQKEMLERYCRENGYTDYTFYVDAAVIIGLKTLRLKKCQKFDAL